MSEIFGALQGIWENFFLLPFYNMLMLTYQTIGFKSLGAAIAILTILMRIVMLPVSISATKTEEKLHRVEPEIEKIQTEVKDLEKQKRLIKETLRENKIDPLMDIFSLGFQAIFFILLYLTFKLGFSSDHYNLIYDFLPVPSGEVNTIFFGVDLTKPNLTMNMVSTFLLFILIVSAQKGIVNYNAKTFSMKWYALILPIGFFLIKQNLAAAKAVFFITSFLFSLILKMVFRVVFKKEFKTGGEV